ncbi:Fe(3+) ABC transporter substrate-binding protein [Prochlorococcus sp. MIT 1303]|uniref:Fe(3+) ABC transporter substrate-binding protein n=1 Tax=Prochlorococcus sp. MIT 1303 TaxID=1723647 RepID=UPI0007B3A3E3|nr:Fe(3+) ABC transporter substrate-binding protein [Prochlorococcus sp. MIT 1303]KZR67828.1 Iron deficiency-induced protein A precursor [Prochlorococcus sp. MIT 1303]
MGLKARLTYSGLAAILALSTGFSQNGVANAREVRVYSGRHYNTDRQIYKKFSEQTGIKVRLIESSGISLLERLKREGANSQADVIILVDAARISNAAKEGLLQPSRSTKLDSEVPSAYRDPQGRWYGLTRRVRVIVANPSKVNVGSIRSYADLASPSLKGKVCLRKRNNVYNQSLVADQLVLRGETATKSWLQGMISNVSQPYFGGDVSLARAVSQGICGVGIVNHYYVARMRAGVSGSKDKALANKITVITPDPAHVNVSAGGLARYAKNKKEAIQLLEFLASPDGSQGMAGPTYEHPLNGYGTSLELKKFGTFRPDRVTISQLGANNAKAIQLMAQSGWK